MATIAIAPAPVRAPKRSIDQDGVDPKPPVKRPRHLNFEKCSFCRKDKKRCQRAGKWPDAKCQRCIEKAFDCSEPIDGKVVRASKLRDHDMDDDEGDLLERIRHIQNQSCWLHDQQSLKRDANAIQRDYLEYSDAEVSRRYHNFEVLLDEAEEEIAISKRNLLQILKTSQSSHQLLYTQNLLSLVPGPRAFGFSHLEPDSMSEEKLDLITEQIDELHRLGATGLAKARKKLY
ncbi:ankyrin repeat-containing domain protein [Venturia nashicola]|nr:ankyrin repeat-containing domain protein [Venturia nashicola]